MKTLFEVHVILRDEVNKSASLLMKRLTNMIELHNSLAKFHQSLSEILGLGGDAIFRSEILRFYRYLLYLSRNSFTETKNLLGVPIKVTEF